MPCTEIVIAGFSKARPLIIKFALITQGDGAKIRSIQQIRITRRSAAIRITGIAKGIMIIRSSGIVQ